MNTNRLWIIGTALIILALVAGTFFLGVTPQLAATAKADADRAAVQTQNAAEEAKLKLLAEQFEEIDELRDEIEALRETIPSEAGITPLIRDIGDMANASAVFVQGISFGDPFTFVPPVAVDSTFPDQAVTEAYGSVSAGNFLVIPVIVVVQSIEYDPILDFVNRLQHSERLLLGYEWGLVQKEEAGLIFWEMNMSAHIYVLLDESGGIVVPEDAGVVDDGATAE